MTPRACLFAVVVMFGCPLLARAQFFGNGAIFEPQVDVVNSGAIVDAQATVSADRKYVTLTMRAQNSELLALRTFQFQGPGNQGPGGIVGGMNPVIPQPGGGGAAGGAGGAGGGAGGNIPQRPNAPMHVSPGNGGAILLTRGFTPLVQGR